MRDSGTPEIGNFVDAGGIKTSYLDEGEGPPVVLLHGSGPGVTGYANWRLVIPALAERFRVIAPDIVGFGFTERPAGAVYGMELWTRHVVGFLDGLGLDRVSIVGNSFGGALALRTAVEHPQRVDRLVLMGSAGVVFPLTEGLDAVWGYQPGIENMKRLLDIFAYDRSLVTDEQAELRYQATIQPGCQEAFSSMFPPPRQAAIERLATAEDLIAGIEHETLVIHGRDDRVVPLETSLRLAQLIPRSELHVFGRCGHWAQIEWADEFSALVAAFLFRTAR